jgi:hypothetical protein
MVSSKNQQGTPAWTTASQLAEMGYCERKLLFKHRLGPRETLSRQMAQRAGKAEHRTFLDAAFRENPNVISSYRPDHARSIRSFALLKDRLFRFIKWITGRFYGGSSHDI